jgi:hypothetical protein
LEPSTWKKPLDNQIFSPFSIPREIYQKLPNQMQFKLLLNGKGNLMDDDTFANSVQGIKNKL